MKLSDKFPFKRDLKESLKKLMYQTMTVLKDFEKLGNGNRKSYPLGTPLFLGNVVRYRELSGIERFKV